MYNSTKTKKKLKKIVHNYEELIPLHFPLLPPPYQNHKEKKKKKHKRNLKDLHRKVHVLGFEI